MTHGAPRKAAVHVLGAAQDPVTSPWAPNPDGRRTEAEAIAIAKRWGVVIPDDIRFVFRDELVHKKEALAEYGGFQSSRAVRWSDFHAKGRIPVKVRPSAV